MTTESNETFSFVQAEHEVLDLWREGKIFAKSLELSTQRSKDEGTTPYIFYDGPPFATGLPHHGHLLASTLKDIVPRYFTMKGHFVQRRFGWDCHGLPVENEIDKKLGKSALEAVEDLGIKAYNDQCRGIVQKYTAEWRKTITRLGRWVDFDNDYKTMDLNFMESVWWVVKQLWDRDYIYQGSKVVPFSTQLQTVLSNFEAGLDYRQTQDPAVTVLFKLRDEEAYMAAWTTTPWTLPSNLALCVGPDISYVRVRDQQLERDIYMAEAALPQYQKKRELAVLSRCSGAELQGKSYHPLFNYFSDLQASGAFRVLADSYVTTETGTGVVHTAPAFGEDDARVAREAGIKAFVCPIDEGGRFTEEVPDFAGQHVKEADKGIIGKLKEGGQLYEHSTYVHSYPFCYRTGTPLIYRTIPCWYVRVESMRQQLMESNAQVNWVPGHIKEGRFGKWLENARDWAISRNRVWGTPIPVWRNDETGSLDCFGSIAQLREVSGVEVEDLHRECVDPITYTREGEPGVYRRIPEVLDCWFESGSMPYAQSHYPFADKRAFEESFPAQFISEGLDQTRGWFYTLTVLATALFQRPAFKNVIVSGLVLAEDGKKMSKSLRNFTPPDQLMELHGADALRLYLINSGLVKGEPQQFSDSGVKEMVRRALLPWYNAYKFFQTYAEVDKWHPERHFHMGDDITDRWIISKLQTLIGKVSRGMESYRLYRVVPPLFDFIDDLTNWYIRLNRRRFWQEGMSEDKRAAYSTLFVTIQKLSTAMAPFAPFLSETIFQGVRKFSSDLPESVHLCSYPLPDQSLINGPLEDAMDRMKQIVLLGRQKRNQKKIKVKIPLKSLTVLHRDKKILGEIAKLEAPIKEELNVREVHYREDEHNYIDLIARPNSPVLGKKLGKDFARFRKLIGGLTTAQCMEVELGRSITLDGREFDPEEILILRKVKEGTNALSNSLISIDLDCQLDEDLLGEGLAREVVNRIQKTRKEMQLDVADRIVVEFAASAELIQAIGEHREYIARETLSVELKEVPQLETPHSFDIDGKPLRIKISTA